MIRKLQMSLVNKNVKINRLFLTSFNNEVFQNMGSVRGKP